MEASMKSNEEKGAEKLMDDYLKSIGLHRKKIAKDGSCLFRAVAEQVLHCQSLHTKVRAKCVEFLKENRESYEAFIEGDFEEYLFKLQDPQQWVGEVEINALAVMYKRDFLIFQEPGKQAVNITDNNFKDKVRLCFLNGNHYDSVYPIKQIKDSALCQSILYELLYDDVFNVDRNSLGSCNRGGRSSDILSDDIIKLCASSDESEPDTGEGLWVENGTSTTAPRHRGRGRGRHQLPERVRRSLNPTLFRNVEYDIWHKTKRAQQKRDYCIAAGMQFTSGDRCQVRLETGGRSYNATIKEVPPNNDKVTVHIEELGLRKQVPLMSLRPFEESSWSTVVNRDKRLSNGNGDWEERGRGRGRGKHLPAAPSSSSSSSAVSQTTAPGPIGRVLKQNSWPPQATVDESKAARKSVSSLEAAFGLTETQRLAREEEERNVALVEIQLRDEHSFPALGAQVGASADGGKKKGVERKRYQRNNTKSPVEDVAGERPKSSTPPLASPSTNTTTSNTTTPSADPNPPARLGSIKASTPHLKMAATEKTTTSCVEKTTSPSPPSVPSSATLFLPPSLPSSATLFLPPSLPSASASILSSPPKPSSLPLPPPTFIAPIAPSPPSFFSPSLPHQAANDAPSASAQNSLPNLGGLLNASQILPRTQTSSLPQTQTSSLPQNQTSLPQTQTSLPQTQTSLPQTQTSLPQTQTSLPQTQTSLPQTQTSLPQTQTSLPQIQTSLPQTQTSLPQTQTSLPQTQTSLPQTSLPQTQTSLPQTQTSSLPQTQTSLPQTQTSLPRTQTSSFPQTLQYLPQTQTSLPRNQPSLPETSLPQTLQYLPQTLQYLPQTQTSLPETYLPQTLQYLPNSQSDLPQSSLPPIISHTSLPVSSSLTHPHPSLSLSTSQNPPHPSHLPHPFPHPQLHSFPPQSHPECLSHPPPPSHYSQSHSDSHPSPLAPFSHPDLPHPPTQTHSPSPSPHPFPHPSQYSQSAPSLPLTQSHPESLSHTISHPPPPSHYSQSHSDSHPSLPPSQTPSQTHSPSPSPHSFPPPSHYSQSHSDSHPFSHPQPSLLPSQSHPSPPPHPSQYFQSHLDSHPSSHPQPSLPPSQTHSPSPHPHLPHPSQYFQSHSDSPLAPFSHPQPSLPLSQTPFPHPQLHSLPPHSHPESPSHIVSHPSSQTPPPHPHLPPPSSQSHPDSSLPPPPHPFQYSHIYEDPLYPGFPEGETGDPAPTPPLSSSRTGEDLPKDVNILKFFFNLGIKAYSLPLCPPYLYLLHLQQTYQLNPKPPSPSPSPPPQFPPSRPQETYPLQPPFPPSPASIPPPQQQQQQWQQHQVPLPRNPSFTHAYPPQNASYRGQGYPQPYPPYPPSSHQTPPSEELQGVTEQRQPTNGDKIQGQGPCRVPAPLEAPAAANVANANPNIQVVVSGYGHKKDRGDSLQRAVLLVDPPLNNNPIMALLSNPDGSRNSGSPSHFDISKTTVTRDNGNAPRSYHGNRKWPYGVMGSGGRPTTAAMAESLSVGCSTEDQWEEAAFKPQTLNHRGRGRSWRGGRGRWGHDSGRGGHDSGRGGQRRRQGGVGGAGFDYVQFSSSNMGRGQQ